MQIVPPVSTADLLEALEGLNWRWLVEKQSGCYTLQPIWMEYVTEKITQHIDIDATIRQAYQKTQNSPHTNLIAV
ncbi:hypothetical protein NUACC21_63610 [Scytonema sp. NUACC21]